MLRQVLCDVLDLLIKPFLSSNQVRVEFLDTFAHDRTPLRPGVGRFGAGETQVEGHHAKRAGLLLGRRTEVGRLR